MKEPSWRDYLIAYDQAEKEVEKVKINLNTENWEDTLGEEAEAFVNSLNNIEQRALEIMVEKGFKLDS